MKNRGPGGPMGAQGPKQKKKKIRSQKFGVVRLRYRASLDFFFDF